MGRAVRGMCPLSEMQGIKLLEFQAVFQHFATMAFACVSENQTTAQ